MSAIHLPPSSPVGPLGAQGWERGEDGRGDGPFPVIAAVNLIPSESGDHRILSGFPLGVRIRPVAEEAADRHQVFTVLRTVVQGVIERLAEAGALPEPGRRGFLLGAEGPTSPILRRFVREVDSGAARIRPRLALQIEASLPTAEVAVGLELRGPTTTFPYGEGGVHAVGLALDLLALGQADLMLVAQLDTKQDEDVSTPVPALISILALGAVEFRPWPPLAELVGWDPWAVPAVHHRGRSLHGVIRWLNDRDAPNTFSVPSPGGRGRCCTIERRTPGDRCE